ncbi:YiiX/YebB-like N1pC/P60 family cysteine hydrolase [Gilliamella sp. Lep-s21]|uniref:YiiX/YebB-like N1pC/P60 family cysteine hydrolase n=1 Tax=unclassified Gilliamella TaxID=2685620 RepID=UPI00130BC18E|nr:hypothetical protein [Gilliamella sp. Lep-s35]MWP69051.1 hypothetical protein [Gilliamella sp. Lep-s5]MWP77286.1 hypothetical protein [Gilliamella sp. Lep-s21]
MLKNNNIQCGDIIFQSLKKNNAFNGAVSLSGAALNTDEITNNINHVGLYVGNNTVIEATQNYGVIEQSLTDFVCVAKYNIIARIHDVGIIKNALKRAKTCLGSPYNHSFHPNANGFYCSELITYAFKTEQGNDYFELYPMNFKNLITKQILPYWIDYYLSIKQIIPQGELGSHPQQLLRQRHLFKTISILE